MGRFAVFVLVAVSVLLSNTSGQYSEPGNLRLVNVNGTSDNTDKFIGGRLEIFLKGEWGTICSTGFEQNDALLACKQLGYQTVDDYGTTEDLGYAQASPSTQIWISNLECDPSRDLTIYHCLRSTGLSCTHTQDVALECSSPYSIIPGAVRLVANEKTSPYLTAGRVELFYVGRWGTVCDDGFGSDDSVALCNILTGGRIALSYGEVKSQSSLDFDQGSTSMPIWASNLDCYYSNRDGRYYCSSDGIGITDCTHSQDLAISCRAEGAVRLVSGYYLSPSEPGSSSGRLEIYYRGEWGTVCDSQFDEQDAHVVCQQLGYGEAQRYGRVASLGYEEGTDTIWLSNVQCSSNDIFLANCSHSGFGNAVCRHSQDVAVTCVQSSGSIRVNVAAIVATLVAASVFGFLVATITCVVLYTRSGNYVKL